MSLLYNSDKNDLKEFLTGKNNSIRKTQTSYQFDPINNDADFSILADEVSR